MTLAYALMKHLDTAEADITVYAQQIRSGMINPAVDGKPILEYPKAIVDEPGRPIAIVLYTEDPHVEVSSDGSGPAYLVGDWRGQHLERRGDDFDVFFNYFVKHRRGSVS